MTRFRFRSILTLGALLAVPPLAAPLRSQAPAAPADTVTATAEGAVRELYRIVSFRPGETTDWAKVRSLFLPEAIVVLRTSRTTTTVLNLDGFINDFIRFDTIPAVARSGFTETIVRLRPMALGNIAHVLVLYEAQVTGSQRPPQQGVDSIHLVRRDERWWIASIMNEIPTPERPMPAELRP